MDKNSQELRFFQLWRMKMHLRSTNAKMAYLTIHSTNKEQIFKELADILESHETEEQIANKIDLTYTDLPPLEEILKEVGLPERRARFKQECLQNEYFTGE